MDNDSLNQNAGARGVFPGINQAPVSSEQSTSGAENTTPISQQPSTTQSIYSQNDTKTYIRLETKNSEGDLSGVLEIDLISFRERGQESRYLSINTIGAGRDGAQSDTTISIDNEADFNRFKKFISELNWND